MSRRKILIGVSIAGHAALFAGVFALTVWDVDQLDYELRSRTALAVMAPPAAEAGSYTPPEVKLERKPPKVVVKETRQPRKPPEVLETRTDPGPSEPGGGTGNGPGDGPPGGDGPPAADPCTTGSPDCAPQSPPPETQKAATPPPPPQVHTLTPVRMNGLRVRGETAIRPSHDVVQQMVRADRFQTSAAFLLCIATSGAVSSVTLKKSSGYPEYDEALAAAARRWVYQPYTVNGTPVPACSMVTFQYAMK